MNIGVKDTSYQAGKLMVLLHIGFSVLSYLYVLTKGHYNGDALWQEVKVSNTVLLIALFLNVAPFFVLFLIYRFYKKRFHNAYYITVPYKALGYVLFFIIAMQIIGTAVFGVGAMANERQATTGFNFLFKVLNRFDPVLCVAIFLAVSGKTKNRFLLFLMLIVRSALRLSLSIVMDICMLSIVLYYGAVIKFLKRYFVLVIILVIFVFPSFIMTLFQVRNAARADENIALNAVTINPSVMSIMDALVGKAMGRLSTFSNTADIIQNRETIKKLTENLYPFQYVEETFTLSRYNYVRKYPVIYGDLHDGGFSGSPPKNRTRTAELSTSGLLLISFDQSPFVFIINLVTIFFCINIVFYLASFLPYKKIYEILLFVLCGVIRGGFGGNTYLERLLYVLLLLLIITFVERYMIAYKNRSAL